MGGRGAGSGAKAKSQRLATYMPEKIVGRTAQVEFGNRTPTVTVSSVNRWAKGEYRRVYFDLENSSGIGFSQGFPTSGYIDSSKNSRVGFSDHVSKTSDGRTVVFKSTGMASGKKRKALDELAEKLFAKKK